MKQTTTAIQIDLEIHKQLKAYCDEKGLKMKKLIEKMIIDETKNNRNIQGNKS